MILKIIYSIFPIIISIMICICPIQSTAEEMIVKKITLGHFKIKDNIILPKSEPYWPKIDRHNLTIDDNGKIYVLNLLNRQIAIFDDKGKVLKKIPLPIEPIKKELDGYGQLEVSGDGKQIFVNIPSSKGFAYKPDFIKSRGFTLSNEGKIINQEEFPHIDTRLCNGNYVFFQGRYVYDKKFQKLKELFVGFSDSEGNYEHIINKHVLKKYNKEGKQLWQKQFDKNFGIIGIDKKNNVYIEGSLRKNDQNSLYKLNSKGDILAQVPIPDPFTFLTEEEKEEWGMHSSEEFLSFFKLDCNGNAYLIYQLIELPKRTFQRWLKGGEYFIYKFETKK